MPNATRESGLTDATNRRRTPTAIHLGIRQGSASADGGERPFAGAVRNDLPHSPAPKSLAGHRQRCPAVLTLPSRRKQISEFSQVRTCVRFAVLGLSVSQRLVFSTSQFDKELKTC